MPGAAGTRGRAGRTRARTCGRELLREQLAEDPPAGMLAYIDGAVVGWLGFGPRTACPASSGRGPSRPSTTCRSGRSCASTSGAGYRRQGVATALLDGLVDYAQRSGAPGVEAYPIDPGGERVSTGFGYVGLTAWFERAGFERIVETDGHSAGRVADPHAPDVLRRGRRSSAEADGAGLRAQPVAMVGMGDADEGRRPFSLAPPEQLGHAELGHDGPGVGPGRDHAGARRQRPDDARDGAAARPWPGRAMMARPSLARAAPRMKSIWPPTPL